MDITGQYFCSFNIKGQPYNEEFKVVLEATVSVYNDLGELQARIISKLPSKQIVIKTLMKENLEQGLELSDVVFDKQIDEIQDVSVCKAVHRYDETSSVKSLLQRKQIRNGKDQQDTCISIRNNIKILQKIRLDCFWVHLPDDGTKDNNNEDTNGEGVNENPPITIIHKKVVPLETKQCESQEKEIHNSNSQPRRLVSLLNPDNLRYNNKTSVDDGRTNNMEIKTEPDLVESIKKEGTSEEIRVVPVGLPFKKIDHENCALAEVNVTVDQVTDVVNASVPLETPDDTVDMNSIDKHTDGRNLSNNIELDETLNVTCPDTDNIETNEVVDEVDNDTGHLMLFCADVRKNEIGAFVNINAKGDEVSHSEEHENEMSILPVTLDHAYKKRTRVRKQNKRNEKSKAANGKQVLKSFGKRKSEFKTEQNIHLSRDLGIETSSDLDKNKLDDKTMKTDNTDILGSNDQEAKTVYTHENDLAESNVKTEHSDSDSNDISGARKRRRCSRNVDYKAIVDSLDSVASESDETLSETEFDTVSQDSESQKEDSEIETPSDIKKSKVVVDPDYQPSDLSGVSGDESNVDEGNSSDYSMAEEDDERISERREKKRKFTEMKMKVNLEEHEDKFEIVKFISTEQRNRGKSLAEKSHDAFSCKICNSYQTADKDAMSLHIGQHLRGKLRCKFCEFESCSTFRNLHHMKQEHPTNMSIATVCEQCGAPFSDNYSRQRHMYNVHKIPAFECRFCLQQDKTKEEKFASRNELRRHTIECHPGDVYECGNCGKHFTERHMYKRHRFRCKNSEENQTIKCGDCGEIYESKAQLRLHHRRTHRKEKLCKCTMCDYVAYTISSVTRHMAHAHLGMYT